MSVCVCVCVCMWLPDEDTKHLLQDVSSRDCNFKIAIFAWLYVQLARNIWPQKRSPVTFWSQVNSVLSVCLSVSLSPLSLSLSLSNCFFVVEVSRPLCINLSLITLLPPPPSAERHRWTGADTHTHNTHNTHTQHTKHNTHTHAHTRTHTHTTHARFLPAGAE